MKKKKINYDVSIQNENSLFYSLFEKGKHYYVLEDKSLGNKIYSESTVIRYNVLNTNIDKKKFFAEIRLSKNCLYFCPDFICDKVESNNYTNFYTIYKMREDLPFIKFKDIGINIDIKNDI